MKEFAQKVVRDIHSVFLDRGLPNRLGLYFHNLLATDHNAFESVIDRVRNAGYRFVDIETYRRSGLDPTSRKLAFVSFDDNYVDWMDALPLLARLDLPATFYLNTAPMRDHATDSEILEYYQARLRYKGPPTSPLSMQQVREIRDAGHTIGAHSHNHYCLSDLPVGTAKEEIYVCRDHLEQGLGQRVKHFSYPFGMRRHFSPELSQYCIDTGFMTIARATPGLLHQRFDGTTLHRTDWRLSASFEDNARRFSIDGRLFERLTGRSAVG
ncbi:MAG: polysaccharide deacetylase family protein [Rhodothermales bacterium]|nr:polysaccharide deacetylase family protein [Rhodothermales bacterium]